MKKLLQAISVNSCQKRRRNKHRITKNCKDLNEAMGACLDLLRDAGPIKIILMPCESQPPSSSRFWMVEFKRKLPFVGSNRCSIVQHTGNSVSEPFQGCVLYTNEEPQVTIIKGSLIDGAVEGKYFELVLRSFSEELNGTCGKNTISGYLQRSTKDKPGTYEVTHDAFLHTLKETRQVFQGKTNTKLKTAGT